MKKILITGAAGGIGQTLVKHLMTRYELLAVDQSFEAVDDSIFQTTDTKVLDLNQANSWEGLLDEVDFVIHLAANRSPQAAFDDLIQPNYFMPYYLFEAARKANKLQRIIYASSSHAAANYPVNKQIKVSDEPRPTSYYGVSKLFMEDLANYFAYHYQIESIGIRIGSYKEENQVRPLKSNQFSKMLDYRDFNHLIDCCLTADLSQPAIVINGVSNNAITRLDLESARQLVDYQPTYDAFDPYGMSK